MSPDDGNQASAAQPDRQMSAADGGGAGRLARKQEVVARPDRAGKGAMTTLVPRRFRKLYEGVKAELDDATMQELQFIALRAFLANFRGVPRAEWQAKWEALRREFEDKTDGFGDD
jgi:hypothetical protein